MGWQDLLAQPEETITVPWTGGREIRAAGRTFQLSGKFPIEHGWHVFSITGPRKLTWKQAEENPDLGVLLAKRKTVSGYLVADRIIPDGAPLVLNPERIVEQTEPVYLLELGLERFSRITAARWEDGRLIYLRQEFPLGPEGDVTEAFQDRKAGLEHISSVTPALHLAFRFECWQRAEEIRLREEAERLAREEAARLELEERRAALNKQLGSGLGRREMARVDFAAAARAALTVGGAELLDWRDSRVAGEAVVQFRFLHRRFECVCQKNSLRIVDSGICLTDHHGNEGRGDTRFTLESLPSVIREAIVGNKLVVYRHVDARGGYVRGDEDEFQNEEDY